MAAIGDGSVVCAFSVTLPSRLEEQRLAGGTMLKSSLAAVLLLGVGLLAVPAAADDWTTCGAGRRQEAIAACSRLIASGKLNSFHLSGTYRYRGIAYASNHEYDRAIDDYNLAIKVDPKFAHVYSLRCLAYAHKRDYQRAIIDCDKAVGMAPEKAVVYRDRGLFYRFKGDHERAIADLDQAIRRDPTSASSYYYRGIVHRIKGDSSAPWPTSIRPSVSMRLTPAIIEVEE
jgi:tetratricopeptide (TPR) repeat protein